MPPLNIHGDHGAVNEQYPPTLNDIPGTVCIQTPGMLSGAKLLLNGEPAPRGPKRGTYSLPKHDGSVALAKLIYKPFSRAAPVVAIDGVVHDGGPPVHTAWMVLALSPLALVTIGGGLGGLCGGGGFGVNSAIARSKLPGWLKGAAMLGVASLAFGVWSLLAALVHSAFG